MNAVQTETKPNGPVAAAFLAAGVGSLVVGIGVVLNEASATIKDAIGVDFNAFLQFDKSFGLGSGVGPLSGKIALAVIAFVVSWVIFHLWLRGKEPSDATLLSGDLAACPVPPPGPHEHRPACGPGLVRRRSASSSSMTSSRSSISFAAISSARAGPSSPPRTAKPR